jgi:1,2-diacylglycerol-3-alpha-glucose alpha-1,2-galactosyltransferase
LLGARQWYGLAKLYLRWFYNRADAVMAVSQEVVDELKRMGVRRPVYLMPNTIDTHQYAHSAKQKSEARGRLGITDEAFVVVGVGQVQPRKRVDLYQKAAKELPDVQFYWVGGMPFKRLAADHGAMQRMMDHPPANLHVTGVIPREEVRDYYWAADLFWLPSVQETFGIVIVEAAAAGLPVLLRDLEQYRTTFHDWYAVADDGGFVSAIERFARDRDFYEKEVSKSRKIANQYDSRAGAKRLVANYLEILEQT